MVNGFQIKQLIDELGMSVHRFEKSIGAKQSRLDKLIKRNGTIDMDVFQMIVQKFQNVSPEWLKTGEGNMFVGEANKVNAAPNPSEPLFITIDRPTQIMISINPMAAPEQPSQIRGNIIKKLKQARQLSGYDLEKMALLSGIPPEDIELIEAGRSTKAQLWEYIQYLHSEGFDINSLFDDNLEDVRIIDSSTDNVNTEPEKIYKKNK